MLSPRLRHASLWQIHGAQESSNKLIPVLLAIPPFFLTWHNGQLAFWGEWAITTSNEGSISTMCEEQQVHANYRLSALWPKEQPTIAAAGWP